MRQSDFDKELELEVVPPDEADLLMQEVLKDKRPARLKEVLPKKSYFGSDNDGPVEKSPEIINNRVDTLREEEECPYGEYGLGLGSDCGLVDGSCSKCGYEAPVEGLDDPDVGKARKVKKLQEQKDKAKEQQEDHHEETKMNRPGRPSFASTKKSPKGLPEKVDKKSKSYPWDQCIKDQLAKGHSQESAEKICGSIKAKQSNVQQVQFLYELIGNGFDQMAEKYIQDEIDAGRADKDLMEAYGVLQTQGPEAFREHAFKSNPLGMDMVEQLYGDDSPEDEPDPIEIMDRKQQYERNLRAFDPELQRGLPKRRPADPGNWSYR